MPNFLRCSTKTGLSRFVPVQLSSSGLSGYSFCLETRSGAQSSVIFGDAERGVHKYVSIFAAQKSLKPQNHRKANYDLPRRVSKRTLRRGEHAAIHRQRMTCDIGSALRAKPEHGLRSLFRCAEPTHDPGLGNIAFPLLVVA